MIVNDRHVVALNNSWVVSLNVKVINVVSANLVRNAKATSNNDLKIQPTNSLYRGLKHYHEVLHVYAVYAVYANASKWAVNRRYVSTKPTKFLGGIIGHCHRLQ